MEVAFIDGNNTWKEVSAQIQSIPRTSYFFPISRMANDQLMGARRDINCTRSSLGHVSGENDHVSPRKWDIYKEGTMRSLVEPVFGLLSHEFRPVQLSIDRPAWCSAHSMLLKEAKPELKTFLSPILTPRPSPSLTD